MEKPYHFYHWRSSHGAEVDLVIETPTDLFAIEIKSSNHIEGSDLRGLTSFNKDYPKAKPLCACTCRLPYNVNNIDVIPWQDLFKLLEV